MLAQEKMSAEQLANAFLKSLNEAATGRYEMILNPFSNMLDTILTS